MGLLLSLSQIFFNLLLYFMEKITKLIIALFVLLLAVAALFLYWPLHQRSVPAASNDKPVDVVLVGGGIMSITLATLIAARLEHPAL